MERASAAKSEAARERQRARAQGGGTGWAAPCNCALAGMQEARNACLQRRAARTSAGDSMRVPCIARLTKLRQAQGGLVIAASAKAVPMLMPRPPGGVHGGAAQPAGAPSTACLKGAPEAVCLHQVAQLGIHDQPADDEGAVKAQPLHRATHLPQALRRAAAAAAVANGTWVLASMQAVLGVAPHGGRGREQA